VNTKDVASEADLQSGDTIQAGQSAFVVLFDGQAKPTGASNTATLTTIAGAAFVAGGMAAAAADDKPKEPSALEIAETLQMSDDVKEVAATVKTGRSWSPGWPPRSICRASSACSAPAAQAARGLVGASCASRNVAPSSSPPQDRSLTPRRFGVTEPIETHRRRREAAAGRIEVRRPRQLAGDGRVLERRQPDARRPARRRARRQAPRPGRQQQPDDRLGLRRSQRSQSNATSLAKAPQVASGAIPLLERR
jgi:hypothetical protein